MKKNLVIIGVVIISLSLISTGLLLWGYFSAKNKEFVEPGAPTAPTPPFTPPIGASSRMQEQYERSLASYEIRKAAYDKEMTEYNKESEQYQQGTDKRDADARAYLLYMVIIDSALILMAFLCFIVAAVYKDSGSSSPQNT